MQTTIKEVNKNVVNFFNNIFITFFYCCLAPVIIGDSIMGGLIEQKRNAKHSR